MLMRVPTATIRTQVSVPLRLPDGYVTEARVFSFDGIVDGREHLTFGLGHPRPAGRVRADSAGQAPQRVPHRRCLRQ
jgi:GTP cyclohydrolase II